MPVMRGQLAVAADWLTIVQGLKTAVLFIALLLEPRRLKRPRRISLSLAVDV